VGFQAGKGEVWHTSAIGLPPPNVVRRENPAQTAAAIVESATAWATVQQEKEEAGQPITGCADPR
jgi:hypothetical protein